MSTTSVRQLGEQYLEQSRQLREHIRSLRPLLKVYRGKQHLQLEQRIATLYQMAEECSNTGTYLKFYYTEGYLHVAKNYRI